MIRALVVSGPAENEDDWGDHYFLAIISFANTRSRATALNPKCDEASGCDDDRRHHHKEA